MYLILYAIFLLPNRSEALAVKAGEHEGFTRVVVPHYADTTFLEKKEKERFIVEFDTSVPALNLKNVFEKISKRRIESIVYDSRAGTLYIDLNCKCEVSTSGQGGRFLIIDVSEKIFEQELLISAMMDRRKGSDVSLKIPQTFRIQKRLSTAVIWPISAFGYAKPFLERNDTGAEDSRFSMGKLESSMVRKKSVRRGVIESEVLKKLFKFVDQGILDKSTDFESVLSNNSSHMAKGIVYQNRGAIGLGAKKDAMYRDSFRLGSEKVIDCPKRSAFNPVNWKISELNTSGVENISGILFDDEGNVAPKESLKLVRKYVISGLLEEAYALSSYTSNMSKEAKVLNHIVEAIVSNEVHTYDFRKYSICEGYLALWEVLFTNGETEDLLSSERKNNADDFVEQFLGIPTEIQIKIASRLERYLDRLGKETHAEFVRRLMKEQGVTGHQGVGVFDPKILAYGVDDVSKKKLYSVNKLISQLDRQILKYGKVDSNLIDLGLAQSGELLGTTLGTALLESTLVSLVLNGEYNFALHKAKKYKVTDTDLEVVFRRSIDKFFELGDTKRILEIGSLMLIEIKNHDLDNLAIYVELLIDIGFVELSKYLIENQIRRSDEVNALHSRILNSESKYNEALDVLGSTNSIPALRERARALYNLSIYHEAMNHYVEVGDLINAARIYWHHGPFSKSEVEFSSTYYESSIYMKKKLDQLVDLGTGLSVNQIQNSIKVLGESKEIRRIVKGLNSVDYFDDAHAY